MSKYCLFINNEKVILRIIIEKDGEIENFFVYKKNFEPEIGNIYKGRIEKILPGLNSCFVNIGEMKSGFLQFDSSEFYLFSEGNYSEVKPLRFFKPGQELMLQICKPGEDEKSPKVTEKISIPGRYLVLLPNLKLKKISKKIEDKKEKDRLMRIFGREIKGKYGFIIRTASLGQKEIYIKREIKFLTNLWKKIKRDFVKKSAPSLLWKELPLYLKVIRDFVTPEFKKIEVDDFNIYKEINKYVELFIPEMKGKVFYYNGKIPIFSYYGLEKRVENLFSKKVFLPSGGYLIIEKGETLTAIDVNSGKIESENLEETILKTNLEAAEEIPRQIKCRNISGLIIVDFIDMKDEYKKKIFKKFVENIKNDKARFNILHISKLGLIEMSREKNDYSIYSILLENCSDCGGTGLKKSKELLYLEIKQKILETFLNKSYNVKLVIEVSQTFYEFLVKNQLFNNLPFFDRIKIKVDNLSEVEYRIKEVL